MKQKIAFALIMGSVTTCLVSFVVIYVNLGFADRFLIAWLRSWAVSYLVVIPCILLAGPKIQNLVDNLFTQKIEKDGTY